MLVIEAARHLMSTLGGLVASVGTENFDPLLPFGCLL
jgi:hypothetical protein